MCESTEEAKGMCFLVDEQKIQSKKFEIQEDNEQKGTDCEQDLHAQ
jgi:hypothetical protein